MTTTNTTLTTTDDQTEREAIAAEQKALLESPRFQKLVAINREHLDGTHTYNEECLRCQHGEPTGRPLVELVRLDESERWPRV